MNSEKHFSIVASAVEKQLVRLASAEVTVHPRYSVHTTPDQQYPTLCYWSAVRYLIQHDHPRMRYVYGECLGGGMGRHGWVELPGGVVFDGVCQRFYDKAKYYKIEAVAPWYRFTRGAAVWLWEQELPDWRWDLHLDLPWAKSASDPTAEPLLIDRKAAESYLKQRRRTQKV
jgi:hypothetical protein